MSLDYQFSADDLTAMRQTQTGHMLDSCQILSYAAGTLNEFNEADAPTYTEGDPVECGLDMRSGSERSGYEMTPVQYDAVLRLPLSAALKETDRVQIIARFGEFIEPLIFEIVSPIQRGPSGIRILLKKVVI